MPIGGRHSMSILMGHLTLPRSDSVPSSQCFPFNPVLFIPVLSVRPSALCAHPFAHDTSLLLSIPTFCPSSVLSAQRSASMSTVDTQSSTPSWCFPLTSVVLYSSWHPAPILWAALILCQAHISTLIYHSSRRFLNAQHSSQSDALRPSPSQPLSPYWQSFTALLIRADQRCASFPSVSITCTGIPSLPAPRRIAMALIIIDLGRRGQSFESLQSLGISACELHLFDAMCSVGHFATILSLRICPGSPHQSHHAIRPNASH
jgi:hypothetical protein